MNLTKFLAVLILTTSFVTASYGQSKDEVLTKMAEQEAQIKKLNAQIEKNRSEQKSELDNLKIISKKINVRQGIVKTLEEQIQKLSNEITRRGGTIVKLDNSLKTLKDSYARAVYELYIFEKQNNASQMVTDPQSSAAQNSNLYYLKKYQAEIATKSAQINTTQTKLTNEVSQLSAEQEELLKLQGAKEKEKELLAKELESHKRLSNNLKSNEKQLLAQAAKHQKELELIQKQISKEVSQASQNKVTPQEAILAKQFEQNKGKLPIPIKSGKITQNYGINPHPTEAGVKVQNNGINFKGSAQSNIQAVFEGEVSSVFPVPTTQSFCVIISHGEYFTVYANLQTVAVKKGEKVTTNQTIGKITDTEFHFEIWKENHSFDPEQWLRL